MLTDRRYAFRQPIKAPSFSATAIIALALGIGATMGSDLGVNYLDFLDWQKQNRSFSDLAFFNLHWEGNVESPDGSTETLATTITTANLFRRAAPAR